jgi:hypothetical protein
MLAVTISPMASSRGTARNGVAIVAFASALTAACSGKSPGDILDGPSELASPATVSVVSVADVDPSWPIDAWSVVSPSSVSKVCNGTRGTVPLTFDMTVRAGAGSGYDVTFDMKLPFEICGWSGVPSSEGHAIEGAVAMCQFMLGGLTPTLMKLESIDLSLSSKDRARLFAVASMSNTEICTLTFDNVEVERRLGGTYEAAGRHDETLPAPLALKGWGEFAVANLGTPIDPATFRRSLSTELSGPLPYGIVLDPNAFAIKPQSGSASTFTVIVGMTNQGAAPVCLGSGKVEAVTNAAGVSLGSLLSGSFDAPLIGATHCLRPGERAWVRTAVSTSDSTAFESAAHARVSLVQQEPAAGLASATPLRVRHPPRRGLEIDFVGDPGYPVVYFLDGAGLPLGFATSYTVFPAEAARPEVATVTFPRHPVSGEPARIQVFPSH